MQSSFRRPLRRTPARVVAFLLVAASATPACSGCRRGGAPDVGSSSASASSPSSQSTMSSWPAASAGADLGAPRPGMVWIPPGVLRAGTPPDRAPRVADEEMAGVPVEMSGFYIDLLPWPNEPNAIPTTNVARDEAESLCVSKGKRLCTELEWERACKGPENATYEYGDVYRKDACGTGVAIEQASRGPTGEHAQCKSGFGVCEMHGGVFEWTSSVWGRGSKDGAQGVLRGGNSVAGELVGRCANAIARNPSKRSPTMGLRCCAGPKSSAEVKLEVLGTPGLVMARSTRATPWIRAIAAAVNNGSPAVDPRSLRAWSWTPVANEQLVVVMGCTSEPRGCALVVGRPAAPHWADAGATAVGEEAGGVLAAATSGKDLPEIARNGEPRRLRLRALDSRGVFSREITYAYGRVEIGEIKRF